VKNEKLYSFGPWRRDICHVDKEWFKGRLVEAIVSEVGVVAICADRDADANLISAAPDLLAVARAYLQTYELGDVTNQSNALHDFTGQIAQMAYAAIDKATGQKGGAA